MNRNDGALDEELGQGKTCFIVSPIGNRLAPVGSPGRLTYENATQMWENVIQPACQRFSLTPVRADKITQSGDIPEQIFSYLRDAEVVIADVTGGNSNVMYELGLRHSRDSLTIQIGEHERLPFDVNTIRTIQFNRTEAGLIDARNTLIEFLRVGLKGDGAPVAATRIYSASAVSLDPEVVASQAEMSFQSDDPADVDQGEELGRLDHLAAGESAIEELSEVLSVFTGHMSAFGEVSEKYAPMAQEAPSFKDRLSVLRKYLDELGPIADSMEETSLMYLAAVEKIDAAMQVFLADFEENPEELSDPEIQGFLSSVIALCRVTEESSTGVTQNLHLAREMRSWSNIVKPVSKTLERAFNTTLRAGEIVVGWAESFRALPGWIEPPVVNFDGNS